MDFALSCMVRNIGRFRYESNDFGTNRPIPHKKNQNLIVFSIEISDSSKKKRQKKKSALLPGLTRSTGFQTLGQWKTATASGAVLAGER